MVARALRRHTQWPPGRARPMCDGLHARAPPDMWPPVEGPRRSLRVGVVLAVPAVLECGLPGQRRPGALLLPLLLPQPPGSAPAMRKGASASRACSSRRMAARSAVRSAGASRERRSRSSSACDRRAGPGARSGTVKDRWAPWVSPPVPNPVPRASAPVGTSGGMHRFCVDRTEWFTSLVPSHGGNCVFGP